MKPRSQAVVGEGALALPHFGPPSVRASRKRNGPRPSQRGGIISKAIFLIFLVLVIGLIYVARHPILRVAGRIWIVDEDPVRSDAIVVLGDDNYNGDRA